MTTTLTCKTSRAAWIDALSMCTGELATELPPTEAALIAEQTFEEAADLEPSEAAEIFALEMPPEDVGTPK